jgi:hypothetical protein
MQDVATSRRLERLSGASRRYRNLNSAAAFLVRVVRLCAPGLVVVLTLVFLSRLLWPGLYWALAAVPLILVGAVVHLWMRQDTWRLPPWRADAATDLGSGNRGLYMALAEAAGPDWEESLGGEEPQLPTERPTRALAAAVALATGLVAVALLPDLRPPSLKPKPPATPVKNVAALVRVLEEDELADTEVLEETKELIERIQENERQTGKLSPEDWQALDRCKAELETQTAKSFRKLTQARETARKLAVELEEGRPPGRGQCRRLAELLGGMDAQAARAMLDKKRHLRRLSKEDRERAEKRLEGMSPDMLQDLLDKLAAAKEEDAPLPEFSEAELEALSAVLKEMQEDLDAAEKGCAHALAGCGLTEKEIAALRAAGEKPGKGGITRGPGPAPLLHTGKTDEAFGTFKPKTFRGTTGEPEVDVGYAVGAPDASDAQPGEAVTGGPVRRFGSGNRRITWTSRLLPRHSDVLRRYFKSEDEGTE